MDISCPVNRFFCLLYRLIVKIKKLGKQIVIQPAAPSGVIKVFRDIFCFLFYETIFIFFCLIIIIQRFKPVIEFGIKLILISIFLIIKP